MNGALVPHVLDDYGALARACLSRYLPEREPRRHLYDVVADYPRRGGRGFRPSLCIATCRAFGGSVDDAVHTAAAVELLHNALLIHDDIQDESEMRRGRPTLHESHGVPIAMNAGDALALLSFRPLLDNARKLGAALTLRLLRETERTAIETAEGQALELGWRRDNRVDVGVADYLEMVLKKTCWLGMIHPTRVGALIATGGAVDVDRVASMVSFGFMLGAAFQIQDDVLNLIGDAGDYGKELDGDIAEGKRTLMIIRLFELIDDDDERAHLTSLLAGPRARRTIEVVRSVRARIDALGCIDFAREVASGLAGAAVHELQAMLASVPASRDREFIEQLPRWVIERT